MSTLEARAAALDLCDSRDEALAAQYGAGLARRLHNDDDERALGLRDDGHEAPSLAEMLRAEMDPWSEDELAAALKPHPHLFQSGWRGLFPVGEVTVWGGPGREGKTTALAATAAAYVVGRPMGGLWSDKGSSAIIYSGEDDRAQYAQKVAALLSLMPDADADLVKRRLIVPDLGSEALAPFRELVRLIDGHPVASGTVPAIVDVLRLLKEEDAPPRLVIFETASTLSEAEESNPGFRALILALRRIAREAEVAVVLSHHVSQAALASLPDLNLSTADIRGGTVLVNNSRQTALVVNLGSAGDPFPERDARTVLRQMVAPQSDARVTVVVTLDSSKGADPPPVFLQWLMTDWGPAAVEIEPPLELRDRPWRKVLDMVRGRRAEARDEAKAEREDATAQARQEKVLQAIARMDAQGQAVTQRRIREQAGMSATVVGQVLSHLEQSGRIHSFPTKAGGQQTVGYGITRTGGTGE